MLASDSPVGRLLDQDSALRAHPRGWLQLTVPPDVQVLLLFRLTAPGLFRPCYRLPPRYPCPAPASRQMGQQDYYPSWCPARGRDYCCSSSLGGTSSSWAGTSQPRDVSQPLLHRIDYEHSHVGYRVDDPRHPPSNQRAWGSLGPGSLRHVAWLWVQADRAGSARFDTLGVRRSHGPLSDGADVLGQPESDGFT
jgi:hypothetical protein